MINKADNAFVIGSQVMDCQEDSFGFSFEISGLNFSLHKNLQQTAFGCLDDLLLHSDRNC